MESLKNISGSDLVFLAKALVKDVRPIENMTRNYYFGAVKYALSGIDETILNMSANVREKMQRKMQVKACSLNLNPSIFMSDDVLAYNKYTDCWVGDAIDNFGMIEKPDCPKEFQKWFDGYAYNGGHPFEIYPYVCLYVRRIKSGFYLELTDFDVGAVRPTEKVIKIFIALQRANIPVMLRDSDLLLKKIQKYNLLNR